MRYKQLRFIVCQQVVLRQPLREMDMRLDTLQLLPSVIPHDTIISQLVKDAEICLCQARRRAFERAYSAHCEDDRSFRVRVTDEGS